jgi:hypothetical protein
VVVDNFQFVGSREGGAADDGGYSRGQPSQGAGHHEDAAPSAPPMSEAPPPAGDDIPF